MFFNNKPRKEPTLIDVVTKKISTGFVFWNINDDLGHSVNEIFNSTPLVQMSYAYARRAAAAAMYTQGIFDKNSYDHVVAMFKGLQQQTGYTVEFQELAAADSIDFMQSYHYLISSLFVKKSIQIANEYDVPIHRISDADLFEKVISTIQAEQNQGKIQITNRMNEIISRLNDLSKSDSKKFITMWITPIEEAWSCEFHFSQEELDIAEKLNDELYVLMEGKVQMPTFAYREQ